MFQSILRLANFLTILFFLCGAANAQSIGAFVGETQGLGTGTEMRPALAVFNGVLYAAWKGVPGDTKIWWSKFDGTKWSPEQPMSGANTTNGPALATFGNALYAAWKGGPGDNRMFWSKFDGSTWSPGQAGIGTGTTDGPSLASFNNALYAAWKGVPGDNKMWWSKFDGTKWSQEQPGLGTGTSARPAIAYFNNTLYAVWKGVPGDNRMWWSKFDGSSKWLPEQQHPGNTSDAPSAAAFNGYLFVAWKGVPGDTRMWWSAFNGSWTGPVPGVGVGTSTGPSLAGYNNHLAAAWKGVPNDTRMWWSQFTIGATAPGPSTTPVASALGQKILAYAQAHLGQCFIDANGHTQPSACPPTANNDTTTGPGECTYLVQSALAANGGQAPNYNVAPITATDTDVTPPKQISGELYTWGDPVNPPYLPGDIIQLAAYKLQGPNGYIESDSQHTAIIQSANGLDLTVLQEHAPTRVVTKGDINLNWKLVRGKIQVFRPRPQ